MAKHKIDPATQKDIEALAAYEPRKRALAMLKDGRAEEFLEWSLGEGHVAAFGEPASGDVLKTPSEIFFLPLSLDRALLNRAAERKAFKDSDARKAFKVFIQVEAGSAIEGFGMSPMEILSIGSHLEAFKACAAFAGSPAMRTMLGSQSIQARGVYRIGFYPQIIDVVRMISKRVEESFMNLLMALYPMLFFLELAGGRTDVAEILARAGLHPKGAANSWRKLRNLLLGLVESKDEAEGGLGMALDPAAGVAWLDALWDASYYLEEALREAQAPLEGEARAKAFSWIAQGAAIGSWEAPAHATRLGDAEMLRAIFANGGEPNATDDDAIPVLISRHTGWPRFELAPEVLRAWLDAGARTAGNWFDKSFFGTSVRPSPLYEWARRGRLNLLKACADHAQGSLSFTQGMGDGRVASDLLAVAINNGHEEVAVWLVEEKGCRLDHVYTEDGEPIRGLAKGQMLARLQAIEDRLALAADPYPTSTGLGSNPIRI